MDLDYRALSNAGLWFIGRLQTDADRERVVDGMADATSDGAGPDRAALSTMVKRIAKRWFVLRNVHAKVGTILVQPRHAITWMRGPLTRVELRSALSGRPAAGPHPAGLTRVIGGAQGLSARDAAEQEGRALHLLWIGEPRRADDHVRAPVAVHVATRDAAAEVDRVRADLRPRGRARQPLLRSEVHERRAPPVGGRLVVLGADDHTVGSEPHHRSSASGRPSASQSSVEPSTTRRSDFADRDPAGPRTIRAWRA
jgi:hypothetical protein